MARSRQQGAPDAAPTSDGLPPDLKLYTPFPFKGLQANAAVTAIDDASFAWIENMVRHADGQLILGLSNDPGQLYTAAAGRTIVAFPNYQIDGTPYLAVFLDDGSAAQIRISDGAGTEIGSAGTFDVTTPPAISVFAGKYLLIATSTAYYSWNGGDLFGPGTLAPQVIVTNGGDNYTSAPDVTIFGGTATGTFTATVIDGHVVEVNVVDPGAGYTPADVGTLQLFFSGGGNSNKIARANAVIGGGGVLGATITNGGTGYTTTPDVTFSGGGASTDATAVAVGAANSLTQILIVTPGIGYTSTPAITIGAPASGDTATAIAEIGLNGISAINIADGGAGYTSTPTVQITDPTGAGSGAVAVAVMDALGAVDSVTILNPGKDYQSAIVTFISGNPTVATATVSLMPQGGKNPVSGVAIQVFKNQVWMVNQTYRFTSAPDSLSDFAASAGGVIAQNTDNNLEFSLNGLSQSSGFLYEFGDSSINAISNPQTSVTNSVATTSYTVTNVDPQTGCIWPGTIQPYGAALIFATPYGVFAVYGSTVRKISDELDDLFEQVPPLAVLPTAAIVIMFGIKFYALSIKIFDPILDTDRQLILLWNGKEWFAATQVAEINALVTANLGGNGDLSSVGNYGYYTAFGSDGTRIYRCFSTPTEDLPKSLISKFYGVDSAQQYKQSNRFYFSAEQAMDFDLTMIGELDTIDLTVTYPGSAGPSSPNAYGNKLAVFGLDNRGLNSRYLGFSLTTSQAAGYINYLALAYRYYSGYYS